MTDTSRQDEYIKALLGEMKAHKGDSADSVFIGGGTPSALGDKLGIVIDAVMENFDLLEDAEFTVEVNPGTVDEKLLAMMREKGVNRLSIGAQSFNDDELKALGRIHNKKDIYDAFYAARRAGFENISLDIMLSTPKQTVESLEKTLSAIEELSPEHVSAYSLIIEEGTPFYDMELDTPNEDEEREIYYRTVEFLDKMGLKRYEISNFAREGCKSRHNIKYWTGQEYLGFGAAAHSYFENIRFSNSPDIEEYIKGVGRGIDKVFIDKEERERERFMLGLRMSCGVKYQGEFKNEVDALIAKGLLKIEDGYLKLTKLGFDLGNLVFMEFVK